MYASVDEVLGPRSGRFFGEGFKRVGHRLTDVETWIPERSPQEKADTGQTGRQAAGGLGSVQATAALSYPVAWSRKSPGIDLRPHVSSIDAALFGIQLAELLVLRRFGLDSRQHGRMWLRTLTLRAGLAPQEEGLGGFPVQAGLASWRGAEDRPETLVSVVDCAIGNTKVRCEIEHDAPEKPVPGQPERSRHAEAGELLGPVSARYYGTGYKERSQYLEKVELTDSGKRASAVLTVRPGQGENRRTEGLSGHYQPALSVLDVMIAFAQVNQVLMYHQDGVRRGETHTLWLRKLVINALRPDQPISAPMEMSAQAASTQLVSHAGGQWRTFTMTGSMPGITGHSMLAHRLPTP